MKVLVVGPSPVCSKGGMSTVISEIANDKELNSNIDIDVFESYRDGNKIFVAFYTVIRFFAFCVLCRNYDVYHIHMASYGSTYRKGIYIRKIKRWGKKVILHIHGAEYLEFYKKSRRKNTIKHIWNMADMVICLSEQWQKNFEDTIGAKNCYVLNNGINQDGLKKAIQPVSVNRYSFACLGRLGRRKGTYDLIDALSLVVKDYPEVRLYLAGDGEIESTKRLIAEKGLQKNVKVLGWLNNDKKIDLLSKVSTVMLPSYNEGLPMAILEGMACGKIIISTNVGAIPEVIDKNNGILVEPGDICGIANAMESIISSSIDIKSISLCNIEKVEREYSMKKMHSILEQYYYQVLQ